MNLQALWIDRQTIAIPDTQWQPSWKYRLQGSASFLALSAVDGLSPSQAERYPYLVGYKVLHLPSDVEVDTLEKLLEGELTLIATDGETIKYSTGLQTAGVLDDLFFFAGKLGPHFETSAYDNIAVTLWAPTAQAVKLLLYRAEADTEPADVVPMTHAKGVWSAEIESDWHGHYYLFSVTVYVPAIQKVVENIVTDPYSSDLALNGGKSRLTNLTDTRTKPEGWDQHRSPVASPHELTIWELHVREFSASDDSVPLAQRGSYLAFTNRESNGMRHLRRLAAAGLKAVHLLPTFHIASINEDKSAWKTPGDLSGYPPDGSQQQAAVAAVQNEDAYNWGYDPVHFLAPEGSYATDPRERVKEYRSMVQALHHAGLRVIQDLVFNHTAGHGQGNNSVLDKIVPGYYHRLDENGNVLNNSCCSDTASEHRMMEKLMIDCMVQNARQYKIDGFRFDLMSFHFIYNLTKIQKALAALTLETDGVDGSKIYLYGEGWTTGVTSNNARGINASQANLHGTGIGSFNDRIRDGIRGGSPFSDPRAQGFATGLYTNPSNFTQQNQSANEQVDTLHYQSNLIRAGLAGNLRDFTFTDSRGNSSRAGDIDYAGQKVGYTASPVEAVNFCSVHDNQVLFDAVQMKAPLEEDTATRARRQLLALSLIALGQGIPFCYSGDEILRSKDMDGNSYNAGDWFNKLDFSYKSNNWGTGLPLAADNQSHWSLMQPLLANPSLKPRAADISWTLDGFEALLRIRASSALFHMESLGEVQRNLSFLHTEPGIIAMRLNANGGKYRGYQQLLVVFNATSHEIDVQDALLKELPLSLHPALKDYGQFDSTTGAVHVKALTTAVFVAN